MKLKKRKRAASPVGLSARKDAVYPLSLARPKGKCKVVQTMINELYCGSFNKHIRKSEDFIWSRRYDFSIELSVPFVTLINL